MALKVTDFRDDSSYDAVQVRRTLSSLPMQPGVVVNKEFPEALRPASTGSEAAPMGFTIGPGSAWVRSTSNNGWYHVVNDGNYEFIVSLDHLTGSQRSFDLAVIEVEDTTDLGSGADRAYFRQVTGTPQASTTWSNPIESQGVASVAANQVPIAVVQNPGPAPAGVGYPVLGPSDLRDFRTFAQGARWYKKWTEGDTVLSVASSLFQLDLGLGTRFVSQSGLVRCRLTGTLAMGAAIYTASFAVGTGHLWNSTATSREFTITNDIASARDHLVEMEWYLSVTPNISLYYLPHFKISASNSTTLRGTAAYPLSFEIEEIWQPDRSNS